MKDRPNVGTIGHIDHGKKVLITGGANGIGRTIIIKAIERRVDYILIDPDDLKPNSGPKKKRGKGDKYNQYNKRSGKNGWIFKKL